MIMIISLAFSALWFCINCLLFILDYFSKDLKLLTNNHSLHNDTSQKWKIYIIIIYEITMTICLIMDLKLVFFHIYLIRNKTTTYDYIIQTRVKNEKTETKKNFKGKKPKTKIMPIPIATLNSPSSTY